MPPVQSQKCKPQQGADKIAYSPHVSIYCETWRVVQWYRTSTVSGTVMLLRQPRGRTNSTASGGHQGGRHSRSIYCACITMSCSITINTADTDGQQPDDSFLGYHNNSLVSGQGIASLKSHAVTGKSLPRSHLHEGPVRRRDTHADTAANLEYSVP
jgi:hypothetical protein